MNKVFTKDPQAVLDYAFDWTPWLAAGETIVTATATATGATVNSFTQAAGVVTVWISGGVVGASANVVCRVVTNSGRTDDRTLRLVIAER